MPELLAILDNCGPLKKLDLSGSMAQEIIAVRA